MNEIRFVAIKMHAIFWWLQDGRLKPNDLASCLFVLAGERDLCLKALPSWAKEILGAEQGPSVAAFVREALLRAETETRLLWRDVGTSIPKSIDALGAAHGLVPLIEFMSQAQQDMNRLSPTAFRETYGAYSPRVGSRATRNLEAALRTRHPNLRIIH